MTKSSQTAQFQTLSKKVEPSRLAAVDSLGWGACQEVLTDVSAWLGQKHLAYSITWSQLSSSPIWWSTGQERASGFIECHPGWWTREKLNCKPEGPASLLVVQVLGCSEVCEVPVVIQELYCMLSPF